MFSRNLEEQVIEGELKIQAAFPVYTLRYDGLCKRNDPDLVMFLEKNGALPRCLSAIRLPLGERALEWIDKLSEELEAAGQGEGQVKYVKYTAYIRPAKGFLGLTPEKIRLDAKISVGESYYDVTIHYSGDRQRYVEYSPSNKRGSIFIAT